jgi:hypothetical protein
MKLATEFDHCDAVFQHHRSLPTDLSNMEFDYEFERRAAAAHREYEAGPGQS